MGGGDRLASALQPGFSSRSCCRLLLSPSTHHTTTQHNTTHHSAVPNPPLSLLSGEISLDEFYDHFKLTRSIFSDMAFSLMDEDQSGEIDFREFILTLWNFCSYDFKELCR